MTHLALAEHDTRLLLLETECKSEMSNDHLTIET